MSRARPSASGSSSIGSESGSWSSGAVTVHPSSLDPEASSEQCLRYIIGHGSRDEHLLGVAHQRSELLAPTLVELGEHVVEDQHRVVALLPQERERRQPQRQRE